MVMKKIPFVLGTALSLLLCGCASIPVELAPVGPNPAVRADLNDNGRLEVFSALQQRRDGNDYDPNPGWRQHASYNVCKQNGERVRHVFNTVGHYATEPQTICLPPGRYLVTAPAEGALKANVPVVIEPGRTTRVHLDGQWLPPAAAPKSDLVQFPGGYPVGWKEDRNDAVGVN